MRSTLSSVAAVLVTALLLAFLVVSPRPVQGQDAELITIQVSPSTLLLKASQGGRVTVHADIPFSVVVKDSVKSNGVPAVSVFPDDCGNLVGKFNEVLIKKDLAPPSADLTLTGMTKDGDPFIGIDNVQVINRRVEPGSVQKATDQNLTER
jgi:hypothetical protein